MSGGGQLSGAGWQSGAGRLSSGGRRSGGRWRGLWFVECVVEMGCSYTITIQHLHGDNLCIILLLITCMHLFIMASP